MPKDSYFTPIDLPDQLVDDVTTDPSIPDWPTPRKFRTALNKIAEEINSVTQGTSKFTPGGINFTTGIQQGKEHGFMRVWKQFKSAPTKENMDLFLEITEQDINLRARREFKKWLDTAMKGKK